MNLFLKSYHVTKVCGNTYIESVKPSLSNYICNRYHMCLLLNIKIQHIYMVEC